MKAWLVVVSVLFLAACEQMPPLQMMQPETKAVITSNKKTIVHHKKSKAHFKKYHAIEKQTDDHLQNADHALDELLKQQP